jgi:predicted ArsR family transcriptional regulator
VKNVSEDRTTPESADVRPAGVPSPASHTERDTRARVARLILEHGPVTASTLGERVGLTPAAVRRHLDALLAEGMIEIRKARATQTRRGRGRPAKWFAITDAGRNAFVHAYDDLATSALRFLAETAGDHAVAEFARRQIADLERRYRPVVLDAPPQQRVRTLAEALSGDGYAAAAAKAPQPGGGEQLCQHHCPVAHVAAEFPQLCEAETEAFSRLLGTPVQRLATIAHGDGICTTHVSSRSLSGAEQAEGPAASVTPGGDAGERSPEKTLTSDEESGRTSL